ncbi:MAG: hypothetical protein Q7W54_07385 [Bacteroidota bacterium]|nr:hypothetical protein [Bacteroidota bacterium]
MNKIKQTVIPFILCFGLIFANQISKAQNSVSLSTVNSIVMDFAVPFDPGNSIDPVIDNSKWLNYNITVTPPDLPVSVTVEITSGAISEGLQIQLQAGAYSGTGGGNPGITSGNLILTNIPKVLISNIGTCNTGIGVNVGHQLTYTLSISDYNSVKSTSSTVNVLFTIIQ